jgi:hypothetical protein
MLADSEMEVLGKCINLRDRVKVARALSSAEQHTFRFVGVRRTALEAEPRLELLKTALKQDAIYVRSMRRY